MNEKEYFLHKMMIDCLGLASLYDEKESALSIQSIIKKIIDRERSKREDLEEGCEICGRILVRHKASQKYFLFCNDCHRYQGCGALNSSES